ncbi:hypothetical protein [Acinetobacter wanghuae]|uniref:hypothetical protein n=1 Tax=Acinetobacter wanghuae TaxID=2662362 RepID=UPI003AF676FE
MSNKNPLNEVALTTTENLAKGLLITSTTSLIEDFAKAVPFATTAIALTQAYSNFKSAQSQRQLLTFIQEVENINHGFIEKFFQNKDNTQIGLEVLGILDQTYLERQARMIGRSTILLKNKEISKIEFDKFTYVITRLNNHLFYIIEQIFNLYQQRKDDPNQRKYPQNSINIQNPNMDLLSFEFLEPTQEPFWGGEDDNTYRASKYIVTENFLYFYNQIFKA